jgi:hypothetical protein
MCRIIVSFVLNVKTTENALNIQEQGYPSLRLDLGKTGSLFKSSKMQSSLINQNYKSVPYAKSGLLIQETSGFGWQRMKLLQSGDGK